MHASKQELPLIVKEENAFSRDVEWGGMTVSYEAFPRGVDATSAFKLLPGGRCQCPHWGYLLKGRLRVKYRDHEEVINEGDLYYMSPGHIPVVEEDVELIEFSPKAEDERLPEAVGQHGQTHHAN